MRSSALKESGQEQDKNWYKTIKNYIYNIHIFLQSAISTFLDNSSYLIITTIFTVYSLIADDIRSLTNDIKYDDGFYITIIISFFFFVIEILFFCYAKNNYFNGFYFWLDILSTISMLMEVKYVTDIIFGTQNEMSAIRTTVSLLRAARASKIGSKAGRIVRIVRLIRLIRIVKLYKISEQANIREKAGKLISKNALSFKSSSYLQNSDKKERPWIGSNVNDSQQIKGNNFNQGVSLLLEKSLTQHNPFMEEGQPERGDKLESVIIGFDSKEPQKSFNSTAKNLNKLNVDLKQDTTQIPRQKQLDSIGNKSSINFSTMYSKIQHQIQKSKAFLPSNNQKSNDTIIEVRDKNMSNIKEVYYDDELEISASNQESHKSLRNNENQDDDKLNKNIQNETHIGQKLSDLTTKRIVVIVMCLMLSIPLFDIDTYIIDGTNYQWGVLSIQQELNQSQDQQSVIVDDLWNLYTQQFRFVPENLLHMYIVYFQSSDNYTTIREYQNITVLQGFRNSEIQVFQYPTDTFTTGYLISAIIDFRYYEQINAIFNMCRTFFICVILAGATLLMSRDVTNIVLEPIEKMLQKINNIKENPLNAVKIEEEDAFLWDKLYKENPEAAMEKQEQENYEMAILEKIIIKIGRLLAIGFGEAGSEIIVQNMQITGEINPMIPGKRIMGIFGFCDIRNFTDTTELLQERVMLFVNEIAEIVHSIVDRYAGFPNKNIGDAFLVVWKFEEESEKQSGDLDAIQKISEMSIISVIKILIELNRSQKVDRYNQDSTLQQNIPNFRVRVGFGLTAGWAIEGPIGSEQKIDASYLSPKVNNAAKLEGATKIYGVPLLISSSVVDLCSSNIKNFLRQIDRIQIGNDKEIIELYTFDANYTHLEISDNIEIPLFGIEKKRQKFILKHKKKAFQQNLFNNKIKTVDLLRRSREVKKIRQQFTPKFKRAFNEGYQNFLQGNWEEARQQLEISSNLIMGWTDGPSLYLIKYMQQFHFQRPSDWKGYHILDDH